MSALLDIQRLLLDVALPEAQGAMIKTNSTEANWSHSLHPCMTPNARA